MVYVGCIDVEFQGLTPPYVQLQWMQHCKIKEVYFQGHNFMIRLNNNKN